MDWAERSVDRTAQIVIRIKLLFLIILLLVLSLYIRSRGIYYSNIFQLFKWADPFHNYRFIADIPKIENKSNVCWPFCEVRSIIWQIVCNLEYSCLLQSPAIYVLVWQTFGFTGRTGIKVLWWCVHHLGWYEGFIRWSRWVYYCSSPERRGMVHRLNYK